MKRTTALLVMVTVLVLGLVPALAAQEPLIDSVCLITDVGKVNDGTFNQFAFEGMQRAVQDFGLESTYIETLAQTDYNTNIQTCIDREFDAIISVGFLLGDATRAAAEANPNVYFIGIDQDHKGGPANLVGVVFREDQPGFLVGAMAALMTKTGKIAGVYGIDVPAVKKFRNGFEQGARFINPDIDVAGVYIDSFVDSARGAETADQFITETPPRDVIFGAGGQTGSGAIKRAAEEGVFVIGVDQDEYFSTFGGGTTPGAEFLITSAIKRVDQGVYLSLKALVEGDLEEFGGGGNRELSAANDGIGFAPSHDADVPEEVIARVQEIFDGLKAGTIVTGVDPVGGDLLPTLDDLIAQNPDVDGDGEGDFNTLGAAIAAAGVSLDPFGAYTIFAPTDAAFDALPAGALDELLADPQGALTNVLLYHVVARAVLAETVVTLDGAEVPTLAEQPIMVSIVDGGVVLNDSVNVIVTDILFRNGVIHVVDAVLLPPGM